MLWSLMYYLFCLIIKIFCQLLLLLYTQSISRWYVDWFFWSQFSVFFLKTEYEKREWITTQQKQDVREEDRTDGIWSRWKGQLIKTIVYDFMMYGDRIFFPECPKYIVHKLFSLPPPTTASKMYFLNGDNTQLSFKIQTVTIKKKDEIF